MRPLCEDQETGVLSNVQKANRVKENKETGICSKWNKYLEIDLNGTEISDFPNRKFKITWIWTKWEFQQGCRKYKKYQLEIHRAEKYSNWIGKINRGVQQQTRSSGRKDQKTQKGQ